MAKFDADKYVKEIDGMSVAQLMKKYGPRIKSEFGEGEYNLVKDDSKGPGAADRVRKHVKDLFMNKGGMVKKRSNTKKLRSGGMVAKKKMRGGGMMKTAAKKKMMRGGAVAKKKMMRGGMAAKKRGK